jgi:aconitate decarboxylase
MASRIYHLSEWIYGLSYNDIPHEVVERTKELFLDWLACAVAGRGHPAVKAIAEFAKTMGQIGGTCEFVNSELGSSSRQW